METAKSKEHDHSHSAYSKQPHHTLKMQQRQLTKLTDNKKFCSLKPFVNTTPNNQNKVPN